MSVFWFGLGFLAAHLMWGAFALGIRFAMLGMEDE